MSIPETFFRIKTITWSEFSFQTPILLQDENGPCPLIALVNTLVLQYEFDSQRTGSLDNVRLSGINGLRTQLITKSGNKGSKISLQELLQLVGDLLMSITESSQEADTAKLLDLLPLLHTGLSVNPNLITGEFPPDDVSTILFTKLFGLNFKHGWVLDSDIQLIQELEYFDKLQDSLLTIDDSKSKNWLEDTKTQITGFGLEKLKHSLDNNEFTIFFRNNHFNTLFKSGGGASGGSDERLYLLLTDTSLRNSKKIIWQSLTSSSGKEDIFYTGDFFPILDEDLAEIEHAPGNDENDSDYQLIKQLQEEEDQKLAQEMQERYNKPRKQAPQASTRGSSKSSKKSSSTSKEPPAADGVSGEKEKKKRPNCVIC